MKCPICDKPTTWKDNPFRPFCSERCKLIDFGNWADENYAVPDDTADGSVEMIEHDDGETGDGERVRANYS